MTKFSITTLETARLNPKQFAINLKKSEDEQGFARKSMFMDWQRSIISFYNTQDENKAIKYLTSAFKTHFVDNAANERKLEEHIDKLQNYIQDTERNKLYFNEKGKKISININSSLLMTGLIPIIYLNSKNGYSAFFFQKINADWENELKFPILQNYIAKNMYGCTFSDVEVGIYSFEKEKHEKRSYSKNEIKEALKELDNLGASIVSYL